MMISRSLRKTILGYKTGKGLSKDVTRSQMGKENVYNYKFSEENTLKRGISGPRVRKKAV